MASDALVQRDDLLRIQHMQPAGARRPDVVRAGATGSGDGLLVLTWSANDLTRERAAGVRILRAAGIAAGMRVANTLPGALAAPGSLLLGDVVEDLGCLDVPLGDIGSDGAAKQAWELIDRVEPNVLILDPSTALRFFAAAPQRNRSWLRGVIWLAVPVGPVLSFVPALPLGIGHDSLWRCTWLAIAEITQFAAHSCSAGHLHLDTGIDVVAVDDAGQLILSATAVREHARLRYATGLQARQIAAPCPCGAGGVVVSCAHALS